MCGGPIPTTPVYAPPGRPHSPDDDRVTPAPGQTKEELAEQQASRDAAISAWHDACLAYFEDFNDREAAAASYDAEQMVAWTGRRDAFATALEAERKKWDRMAMCGLVPANVVASADDVGKYLVPVQGAEDTISAILVPEADLTLAQYIRAFGIIDGIGADGRPLVLVKIG